MNDIHAEAEVNIDIRPMQLPIRPYAQDANDSASDPSILEQANTEGFIA